MVNMRLKNERLSLKCVLDKECTSPSEEHIFPED
jgi:hypothetical protein